MSVQNWGAVTGSVTAAVDASTIVPNGGYTIPVGAGSSGTVLTSGAGNPTWSAVNTNTIGDGSMTVERSGKLELRGDNADIVVNGVSLCDTLKHINERLHILTRNHALESELEELRELGERYRALEKQTLDALKTFERLKRYD